MATDFVELQPQRTIPGPGSASRWSLALALGILAFGMPALFYLNFGYLDGYAYTATAFFMLLITAVDVVERRTRRFAHEKQPEFRRSRFDFLGVVWLLSIPFAPVVTWFLTNAVEVNLSNWRALHSIRAILCIPLPIVCALPLLRFLRRPHVAFMLMVLIVGTAFPIATAWNSTLDVFRGPAWQQVTITGIRDIAYRTRAGTSIEFEQAFIDLEDGRALRRLASVEPKFRFGPARLLVLRHLGQILDAQQEP